MVLCTYVNRSPPPRGSLESAEVAGEAASSRTLGPSGFFVAGSGLRVTPERIEVELEASAAGDLEPSTTGGGEPGVAILRAELEDLEGLGGGVDQPVPADTEAGVLARLVDAIARVVTRCRGD